MHTPNLAGLERVWKQSSDNWSISQRIRTWYVFIISWQFCRICSASSFAWVSFVVVSLSLSLVSCSENMRDNISHSKMEDNEKKGCPLVGGSVTLTGRCGLVVSKLTLFDTQGPSCTLSPSPAPCLPALRHASHHADNGLNLWCSPQLNVSLFKSCCGHGVSSQ